MDVLSEKFIQARNDELYFSIYEKLKLKDDTIKKMTFEEFMKEEYKKHTLDNITKNQDKTHRKKKSCIII